MKIARFSTDGRTLLGVVEGMTIASITQRVVDDEWDMIRLIQSWPELRGDVEALRGKSDFALNDVTLLAPVARPGKILGIGLNYHDHVAETSEAPPSIQTWFTKAVTSIADPYGDIELPRVSRALDYEAELVVVIGAGGRHIAAADAGDAIFGYCVGNDVSVRDWQLRTGQYSIGKSFDTHAPIGPWIVTADEIDPHALALRCFVNGEKRQESDTRHLIFDCYDQVAHLSEAMTLQAGDLLFTGTPSGVGAAMQPPQFLAAGDRVRVEIQEIGAIENVVVEEAGR